MLIINKMTSILVKQVIVQALCTPDCEPADIKIEICLHFVYPSICQWPGDRKMISEEKIRI